jgi:hypothetical protein
VTKHAKTKTHIDAVTALTAPVKSDGKGSMPYHSERANDKNLRAMQKRMRSLYYLCKECIAISKFNSLIELEEENGAYDDVVGCLEGPHSSYTSRDFANDCIEVLATTVREEVLQMIKQSPYVGVMIDEGTDINITSQLVRARSQICSLSRLLSPLSLAVPLPLPLPLTPVHNR